MTDETPHPPTTAPAGDRRRSEGEVGAATEVEAGAVTGEDTPTDPLLTDPRFVANGQLLARRTHGGTRVVGGLPVKPRDFLDCVAVGSDAGWACTGTLVAPNAVLTAGHCAGAATRVHFGHDVSLPGKIVGVRARVRHPQYRQGGRHNDVMVLVLAETVTTVGPRAMAGKAQIDAMTDGRVVGFGAVDAAGRFGYGIKRYVDVPVASPDCRGSVGAKADALGYGCDPGLELVAGRPLLERDSCRGDSGGPFYLLAADGGWLLAGTTSRATDSAVSACGDGGIYARIDRYRAWVGTVAGVDLP